MSRLCRLKSYKDIGDDGRWAFDAIVKLRKERDELVEAFTAVWIGANHYEWDEKAVEKFNALLDKFNGGK